MIAKIVGRSHIGGMWNDNPERLGREERLAKQFRETTPKGRLFLLAYYAVAGAALFYFATWLNEALKPSTAAFGQWVAAFFN